MFIPSITCLPRSTGPWNYAMYVIHIQSEALLPSKLIHFKILCSHGLCTVYVFFLYGLFTASLGWIHSQTPRISEWPSSARKMVLYPCLVGGADIGGFPQKGSFMFLPWMWRTMKDPWQVLLQVIWCIHVANNMRKSGEVQYFIIFHQPENLYLRPFEGGSPS